MAALDVRNGHFLLESGLHADTWIHLDALFLDPRVLVPQIESLAALLAGYRVTAVCGPLLGGAFVAQRVAERMGVRCYFAQRVATASPPGLFGARYRIPDALRARAAGERVALVDDVISAGSSVRAVHEDLAGLDASVVVVGALLVLGERAVAHFSPLGIPLVAPATRGFTAWEPAECPLCRAGIPLTTPA